MNWTVPLKDVYAAKYYFLQPGTRLLLDEEGGAAKISKAARREQEEAQGRHHACMVSW